MIFIMHTKRILVCAVLLFILYLVIRWLDGKPLLEGYGGHGFGGGGHGFGRGGFGGHGFGRGGFGGHGFGRGGFGRGGYYGGNGYYGMNPVYVYSDDYYPYIIKY